VRSNALQRRLEPALQDFGKVFRIVPLLDLTCVATFCSWLGVGREDSWLAPPLGA